jgi:acyl dehydratase
MALTFAIELLRRHFGARVFNHSGMVDLRFLRPVRPGDTLTIKGKITGIASEANGSRVSVDIEVINQDGNTAGVGSGSVVIPNAYLSPEAQPSSPS